MSTKMKCIALGGIMALSSIVSNHIKAQNGFSKKVDNIELTTKQNSATDLSIESDNLTKEDEKKATKLVNKMARNDRDLTLLILATQHYFGQEKLFVDLMKKGYYADFGPVGTWKPEDLPSSPKDRQSYFNHMMVNAKDVFEKSGIPFPNPIKDKEVSEHPSFRLEPNTVKGKEYSVKMQVNDNQQLDGQSIIYNAQEEAVAYLNYEQGKFIGGTVNGVPIDENKNKEAIAFQKAVQKKLLSEYGRIPQF